MQQQHQQQSNGSSRSKAFTSANLPPHGWILCLGARAARAPLIVVRELVGQLLTCYFCWTVLVSITQVGPRLELEVIKVEDGMGEGRVIFHK